MAFLRVLRVFFVVAGLGLAALGLIMGAVFGGTGTTGGHVVARWWCEPEGDRVECQTNDANYAGPRGVIDGLTWLGYSIGGVALIGAAVALGQFDRPRQATGPGPQQQYAAASSGPGQQPQGGRPPGNW
ncbi:hypothetical protein [Actinophytocola algeriensis]|uniref:Uncharacterized protein n=1 Tax=Actinophytocola algeriensis TaxID=1768010 RepID=A0A7W7Q1R3_9PSEU|nr:hypothetical protein [Actinophytocola algeriensis]MBB4905405.1 hypothetical protein [Actinophytocola algeriensis]MBE1472910.1 hypothetical protein [Actinophytocola algeriensis]